MATARRRLQQGLVYALVISLLLATLVAVVTSRSVRNPTRELLRVADALRKGDWQPARELVAGLSTNGVDAATHRNELVRLAQAFGSAGVSLEQRDRRLRSTNVVCAATSASLDGAEISEAVLAEMCAYVQAEVGAVYLRDDEQERLTPIVTRALDRTLPAVRFHEGIVGQAAATRKTVAVRDIPTDTAFAVRLGIDSVVPKSVVAVPFSFDNRLLGVVVVASVRDLADEDVEFLEFSSAQLSMGIENVRAFQTVQRLLAEVGQQREQLAEQFERLQGQHEELQAQHEEIQAQGEELQAQSEEIQSQNEELQAQTNALLDADDQKNRFLGLLAHELRNPMAAISNSLYLLSQADGDSSLTLRARNIIERQTRQLTRLVDDLLDITRIAKGKLHIERTDIDFAPIVRDCVEDHRSVANAAGITIDCVLPETPMPVYGDAVRLRQVIGNLLDNAIKFCSAGGAVRVWGDVPSGSNEVVLTVTDDGIGIDPELHEHLFRPFMQADPTRTRSKGGLGLGLSLVRAYVTLHAGTVTMRSKGIGTGCEFTVRLPLNTSFTPSQVRSDNGTSPVARKTPRRVLVIEDNQDGAESLRDALALDGHDVRVASSVDHALEVAGAFTPHVALCDVGLPGTDGYEFARRARQDGRLQSMRIVALTGYAAPDDKQAATEAGFDGHITKPANIAEIRTLLAAS
jgi:signal transduction histidine kinase/HAMP domain-containing protein